MQRVAINGFGRIGRNIVRAYFESAKDQQLDYEIVAINDLADSAVNAHLLKFDTTHGEFACEVLENDGDIMIDSHNIRVFAERDPAALPWRELEIDLVLECTGFFTSREAAQKHIEAGAKKVLLSAPGKNMDATIVYGVNDHQLSSDDIIVSNASCTTNCLAPVANALHAEFGISKGLVNTVHAYTNDQSLIDVAHADLRRARAAGRSMIPSKTGAAAAIGLVIPELEGKLDGLAVRVPVLNVSLLDLTVNLERSTSVEEVNSVLTAAAGGSKGVLEINTLPLVSSDFNHKAASSIVDSTQTMVDGDLVKVLAWYDNEWGFSNRMLDTARVMLALSESDVLTNAA